MIDLDDQLTAYSRYLDDAERPLVPLDGPATADSAQRTSRRRFLSMSAAAAVTIVGGAVIARVATRGDDSPSFTLSPLDPDWRLVPDPDGLFTPAPMRYDRADPNSITINGIADTSLGLIAVGSERRDFTTYNAMWRSPDGRTWERLPNNDDFGTTEFTGASARTLGAVTELDGRIVGTDQANFWWSDDLEHWESVPIPRPSGGYADAPASSVCAGPAGFVAAGEGLWFSPDGTDWASIDRYARLSTSFYGGGATYAGDQFVVAGTLADGPNVVTSPDGQTWTHQRLPGDETDWPMVSCGHDGTLVLLGAAWPDGSPTQAVAWTSTDGGTRWTRIPLGDESDDGVYPSVLVHTHGEFVAVVGTVRQGELTNVQFRSHDGLEWTERAVDLPGFRIAATGFDDGAVAVGIQGSQFFTGPPPTSTDDSGLDPANAASIWTLGL